MSRSSVILALTGLQDASTFAPRENALFFALLGASVLVLAILTVANGIFLVRYRRGRRVDRTPLAVPTWKIETTWSVATTVIFLGFFVWGARLYLDMEHAPENTADITVIGRQWMWDMRYADGRREFNALHLQVGQPVRLLLSSEDVIHSVFIPDFRVKQDVVPGKQVSTWFTPTKTGEYPLFCAQYCGSAHSQMIGRVMVLSPEAYAAWATSRLPGTDLAIQGQRLFGRYGCSGCHTPGATVSAPLLGGVYGRIVRLADGTFLRMDEVALHDAIIAPRRHPVAGYAAVMPAYDHVISEPGVLALIAYLKTLAAPIPGPGTPSVP